MASIGHRGSVLVIVPSLRQRGTIDGRGAIFRTGHIEEDAFDRSGRRARIRQAFAAPERLAGATHAFRQDNRGQAAAILEGRARQSDRRRLIVVERHRGQGLIAIERVTSKRSQGT